MARIRYESHAFTPAVREVIAQADAICREYGAQGFRLTLRQLYYQFVSRDLIPNRQREYKRLGDIVNNARLAGELDWDYIEDRTRNLEALSHWDNPAGVIAAAARSYNRDVWESQPVRVEVWIEKDALAGVIEPTCQSLDVPFFSCRGYASQSEMHAAGQRLGAYIEAGQRVVILHLGDHDPSGLDMTRDITDRLDVFVTQDFYDAHGGDANRSSIRKAMAAHAGTELADGGALEVRRIALTMDQVLEYGPPPNPAKATDARFRGYSDLYGDESWELDALEPTVLAALISEHVSEAWDQDLMDEALELETEERAVVERISDHFTDVATYIEENLS